MIAKSQENSREVARLLERAAAAAFGMETEDIVPHFDEIEVKCLSLVSSKGFETEIQRRVLEWKLRLLCDRNVSLSEIEKLHGPLRNLGYSNLENEANIELYLAQYCVRQHHYGKARAVLTGVLEKLQAALVESNEDVYLHFKEVSERLLSEID